MPTWRRRRLNRQERWVMAYVRRHEGATVSDIRAAYNAAHIVPGGVCMETRSTGRTDLSVEMTTKTEVRGWIRSAQLKGAPIATTAHGVVIARGTAVREQALRMKIHALGELRNAAILLGCRLSDRLVGQLDAMGREGVR